uniref:Uncharacterized protein n=1 Tax=Glossina austeni TaxID=7395 RepID=A0A1A9UGW5_GLOAU
MHSEYTQEKELNIKHSSVQWMDAGCLLFVVEILFISVKLNNNNNSNSSKTSGSSNSKDPKAVIIKQYFPFVWKRTTYSRSNIDTFTLSFYFSALVFCRTDDFTFWH